MIPFRPPRHLSIAPCPESTLRAGPLRSYAPPAYGTRREALADPSVRPFASTVRLTGSAVGLGLVVAVATAPACTFGCITICPTVYLSEGETLDIVQEQFTAHGYTLQEGTGGGPANLPFEPDLANWDAGLIAEIITEEECAEYQQAAEDLLATGDARCGIDDTAAMPMPRRRSYESCTLLLEGCGGYTVHRALPACFNFACTDLLAFVTAPAGACEGEDVEVRAREYIGIYVDLFFEDNALPDGS